MSSVLAAVDGGPMTEPVLHAASAMARSLGASARAIHVDEGPERASVAVAAAARAGIPSEVIDGVAPDAIIAAADATVRVVVIGGHAVLSGEHGDGAVALAVVTSAVRPVLVVPPGARVPEEGRFCRAFVPLEGTESTAEAVRQTVRDLAGGGVTIVAAHVFDAATAPRFWDQSAHAAQSWATEFLECWCGEPGVDLHLRAGDVPGALLDVARSEAVDVIALGWAQNLGAERALVVKELLRRSGVPVLLIPVSSPDGAGPTDEQRESAVR